MRERYGVLPFARAQAQRAPSRAAVRERLKRYRKKEVEPRVWAEAEEEVARERAKPANALYNLLHPGAGPVAHVLEGHEWGPATLQDYRRWARMRVLLDKWPQSCPVCGAEGATAAHILGEHAVPVAPLPSEAVRGGVLWYLRTDVGPADLRRNIRLVGQLLRNGTNWGWVAQPGAGLARPQQ